MLNLTTYEYTLLQDADVIRAKNKLIEQVAAEFSYLAEAYRGIATVLPGEVHAEVPPKISRGEKYEGLPYLVLDYPRLFTQTGIFAIRTLFWWGNYWSTTLHLQGKYLDMYAHVLSEAMTKDTLQDWYVQVNGDMWQHAIRNNYELIRPGKDYLLDAAPFVKISKKIPLQKWDQMHILLKQDFEKLVQILYAPIL